MSTVYKKVETDATEAERSVTAIQLPVDELVNGYFAKLKEEGMNEKLERLKMANEYLLDENRRLTNELSKFKVKANRGSIGLWLMKHVTELTDKVSNKLKNKLNKMEK
jgi:hypothetical protein